MKKLVLVYLMLGIGSSLIAQKEAHQVISSSGGHFENNLISLDWTLGEPVILTFENQNYTLTQGFHQDFFKLTEVEDELFNRAFEVKAYPNPASSHLNLEIVNEKQLDTRVKLYDINGKCLLSKDLGEGEVIQENIDVSGLNQAMYILKIMDASGKEFQTFKIQKIK